MTQLASTLKSFNYNTLLKYIGIILFIFVILVFSISSPVFLTGQNIVNILVQSSVLGIVALGITVVLIGGGTHVIRGGMDLSLANNLAINVAIISVLLTKGHSFLIAFGIAFLCSIIIGVINAFTIVNLKVIPLLGTLAIMYLLKGIELLITDNKVVGVSHPVLDFIKSSFLGLPIQVWFFAVVSIIFYVLFNKSVFGNWVYAVGGNPQAAQNAGINVRFVLSSTYIIAAFTAAIASLLVIARINGSVPGLGDIMLLDILLVGFMSAIFSRLAVPNIPGAILSAIFVGMLSNGFTLINVPTYWVYAIKGSLILVAVAITTTQQRRVS
ncbi:ABC transporter permease [Bacillus sp. Marseille-P3661]|uniref:ABC transporter permease n=1 Tax=Bacillus sp. Marseille-P3661 TaxID=1936234 RepID=UPI000C83801A|nr:ABC transporter permease [Bacillus sp. Marseille-P3661]